METILSISPLSVAVVALVAAVALLDLISAQHVDELDDDLMRIDDLDERDLSAVGRLLTQQHYSEAKDAMVRWLDDEIPYWRTLN